MTDKVWTVDDDVSQRYPLYTRGNVGEVFPDVVAPLTWSTSGLAADRGWRNAFAEFGALRPSDFDDRDEKAILGVFGGYWYLNLSLIRLLAVRTPGLTVEALDTQLFGESDAPAYVARPSDKSRTSSLRIAGTLLRTLRARTLPRLEADKARVATWLAQLPDPASASDARLLDAFLGYTPLFQDLFQTHILTTFQATVGPGLLAQICAGQLGDPTLANTLIAGIGSIESAAPSAAMWDWAGWRRLMPI